MGERGGRVVHEWSRRERRRIFDLDIKHILFVAYLFHLLQFFLKPNVLKTQHLPYDRIRILPTNKLNNKHKKLPYNRRRGCSNSRSTDDMTPLQFGFFLFAKSF